MITKYSLSMFSAAMVAVVETFLLISFAEDQAVAEEPAGSADAAEL